MPATLSLWKRVENLFRASDSHAPANGNGHGHGNGHGSLARPAGNDAIVVEPRIEKSASRGDIAGRLDGPASVGLWSRRRAAKQELRDGYLRVIELMDAMEKHFEQHDTRAEQLGGSVERLAATLKQLAEIQQNQAESIAMIAARVDAGTRQAESLANTLEELPVVLSTQAHAVQDVAREMKHARQTGAQLVQSVESFGGTVETLRQTGAAQTETLERLHAQSREERDEWKSFIHSQNRRFLIFSGIAALLGIGIISALALTLIRVISG